MHRGAHEWAATASSSSTTPRSLFTRLYVLPTRVTIDGDRGLIASLDEIATAGIAVTMGKDAAKSIDADSLMTDLATAFEEMKEKPAELIPVLDRLEAMIRAGLAGAPKDLEFEASSFKFQGMKWRPDPPAMPREIVGFMVLDRVVAEKRRCVYALKNARYEALRNEGDRCDCAARIETSFFHRPLGPLKLLDESGVPYAAMDYLWLCEACGAKWFEDEGHDDMGSHSTWRPAPADAVKT